jgi:hypothetical protein
MQVPGHAASTRQRQRDATADGAIFSAALTIIIFIIICRLRNELGENECAGL